MTILVNANTNVCRARRLMPKGRLASLLIAFTLAGAIGTSAQAGPLGFDWFSSTTTPESKTNKAPSAETKVKPLVRLKLPTAPIGKAPAPASSGEQSAAEKWFEQFDQLKDQYRPSAADRVILSRPLMQDEDRVIQWTNTANKISKNYMHCVIALKQMPVPAQLTDLKQLRDLSADWYGDAARVFDEMIRPRKPAETIEQLHRELDAVRKESETLVATCSSLAAMDQELRLRYKVKSASSNDDIPFIEQPKK